MKSNDGKLELRYLHVQDIQINFNLLCNLHIICNSQKSISSFYEEDNFEPCLTKQFLTKFKLWYEWGCRYQYQKATKIQPTC